MVRPVQWVFEAVGGIEAKSVDATRLQYGAHKARAVGREETRKRIQGWAVQLVAEAPA